MNALHSWAVIIACFGALVLMWALSSTRSKYQQAKIKKATEEGNLDLLKALILEDKLIDGQRDQTYRQCIEIAHEKKYSKVLAFLLEDNVFPLSWEERVHNFAIKMRDKNKFWYVFAYIFFKPRYLSKDQFDRLNPSFNPLYDIQPAEKQRMFSETHRF